jgi:MFS transporter, DHA2 family, multidrug resistance protein
MSFFSSFFPAYAVRLTALVEMILYRAGQGFTGGVMIPISLTVALSSLPKRQQPFGLALFGMTATLGPAIGPLLPLIRKSLYSDKAENSSCPSPVGK